VEWKSRKALVGFAAPYFVDLVFRRATIDRLAALTPVCERNMTIVRFLMDQKTGNGQVRVPLAIEYLSQ
jgi:hypothetical protein